MIEKVRAFLQDPPASSKTRAALAFGIDPTPTVRKAFVLTPGAAPRVVTRADPKPDA